MVTSPAPTRTRLPDDRPSVTQRFCVHTEDGAELRLYLTASVDAEGRPREVFVHTTDRSGWVPALEALAIIISVALQYGVPLEALTSKLRGMAGRPCGTARVPWRREGRAPVPSLASLLAEWLTHRFPEGEKETPR